MDNLETLLKGCIDNQRKSQEKLYYRFYPGLYALCKRFFNDKQDIVSALNNGMLRVFKNIDQWDSTKGNFENWLYAIVRNSALSQIREAKKFDMVEYHENLNHLEPTNISTIHDERTIQPYVDMLPETSKIVCNLFYFDSYSIKDIAQQLDIKEGTVKWHLHFGREQIKNFLNNKKR